MANSINTSAGSVRLYFGAPKARGHGLIVTNYTINQTGEDNQARDENNIVVYWQKSNIHKTGTLDGMILRDETGTTNADAREALQVGQALTLPECKAFNAIGPGLAIIDNVDQTASNSDFATMSISFTIFPQITEFISDSSSPAADEE